MTYNENPAFNQLTKALHDANEALGYRRYLLVNGYIMSHYVTRVFRNVSKISKIDEDTFLVVRCKSRGEFTPQIHFKYNFATKNKLNIVHDIQDCMDLLKIEQSRYIYKLWDKTHFNKLNEHIVTNQTKTEIVLIPYGASEVDKGRKWKSTDCIWYNRSRAKMWVTRILFNKGHKIKSAGSLIEERDVNGKKEYYANINGNEFVFNTPQYASYFLGNFYDYFSKIRHRQDKDAPCITFFQYKDKSCR